MNRLISTILAAMLAAAASAGHVITIDHPVMSADEGLMLGNGDLSCSVYQTADDLVFRLGKGDVWDRRLDYSEAPKPPTVDEIIDGVMNCGWKVVGWNASNVEEMKKMPKGERLLEITKGKTPLRKAPYPCPKPTGELRLRLPLDLGQPERVMQKLFIEEGRAEFEFLWKDGKFRAIVEAVVDPERNVLALEWRFSGWTDSTHLTTKAPLCVSVHRWADPVYNEWLGGEIERYPSYPGKTLLDSKPLPPPVVIGDNKIEQRFYPDAEFKDGFRYRLTLNSLISCGSFIRPSLLADTKDAYILHTGNWRTAAGAYALTVTTSRDGKLDAPKPRSFEEYKARAAAAGTKYWAKSSFSMPNDRFLENLWYSTYHARRCVLRGGAVAPGLFFPSSLPDFSRWNGDWHGNYNFQSIFWGDFIANRLEQCDAYFDAIEHQLPFARMMAKKYYSCRGAFFQLQQFPVRAEEDYNGTLPLGRMAYMTGWMMSKYWQYYLYTMDRAWLARRGYPVIRECALFYLDFLKKAPDPKLPPQLNDGKYHAFPSVQGESGFKNPMDFCDKGQVLDHARYALNAAVEASAILGVDEDLRRQWIDRRDNLVGNRAATMNEFQRHRYYRSEPDDGSGPVDRAAATCAKLDKPYKRRDTYLGISHWAKRGMARSRRACCPEEHFAGWRQDLVDWTHQNGLVWGMAIRIWQRTGGWTESLSCMSPFQEMILQSWDGTIDLFSTWPKSQDVEFSGWRAQGGFLVSAAQRGGRVVKFEVTSLAGETCSVYGMHKVEKLGGGGERKMIETRFDKYGRLTFKTEVGARYSLTPAVADK